jgi:hypothetical protein
MSKAEMSAILLSKNVYIALATGVLFLHVLFILWVILGGLLTRSRPWLRWFHIVSLLWGILVEVLPWPCPLTILEDRWERQAGIQPYQGGFLLHYLDALVYPNISATLLMIVSVAICALNLGFYVRQFLRRRK